MRYAAFETLETSNLMLRKFRLSDVDDFYRRVAGNNNVTKYMLFESHQSTEETKWSIEKILSRYKDVDCYTWAIALREDDSIIGRIDLLRLNETESSCSFAYMIGDSFWGQGYGTETLSAILKYAFEKLQMQVVIADHMSENTASGAVMKKAGMRYVQTHVAKYKKTGNVYDADEYRICYRDWNAM